MYPQIAYTKEAWMVVTGGAGGLPLFKPDEGLRLLVLYTAGQHGDVELAHSVLQTMEFEGQACEEHHYAALVEAYARAGEYAKIFSTLSKMRREGVAPSTSTTIAAIDALGASEETVVSALSALREQHDAGVEAVDVESFQLVLSAYVKVGLLEAALDLYKDWPEVSPNFRLRPNAETFNILLRGCADAGQIEVASLLVDEMRVANVPLKDDSYDALIMSCVNAPTHPEKQRPYQLGLMYLEKASNARLTLSQKTYEALAGRCIDEDDVESGMAVLDEMDRSGWDSAAARLKIHTRWREAQR